MSIDQRLAVWQWQLQDKAAAEKIHPDSSAGTCNIHSPPTGILLTAADNSAACELKSVRCSSVADIQDAACYAAHHHEQQQQFVICVGIGLEIFRLKI